MTIPCNKNITKQLNTYSYVIVITGSITVYQTEHSINLVLTNWITKKKEKKKRKKDKPWATSRHIAQQVINDYC